MTKIIEITADNITTAVRADVFILNYFRNEDELKYISRAQIKLLIKKGLVYNNDKLLSKSGAIINNHDVLKIELQLGSKYNLTPYKFPLSIVYEDSDLVVVDKPYNLTVHPGAGNKDKTLVNALIARDTFKDYSNFEDERPGIVHRIDKDTSGLIVVAKNLNAQNCLSKQFANREVSRNYKALVYVTPRSSRLIQEHSEGEINEPIGRSKTKPTLMEVSSGKSEKEAITTYKVLEKYNYAYLLDIKLKTGRTHQIRVHFEHKLSPLIGDKTYCRGINLPKELELASENFGRQALHAYKLGFIHPKTDKYLEFESNLPDDFKNLVNEFKAYA